MPSYIFLSHLANFYKKICWNFDGGGVDRRENQELDLSYIEFMNSLKPYVSPFRYDLMFSGKVL